MSSMAVEKGSPRAQSQSLRSPSVRERGRARGCDGAAAGAAASAGTGDASRPATARAASAAAWRRAGPDRPAWRRGRPCRRRGRLAVLAERVRGHRDDRHRAPAAFGAHAPRRLQAVELGHLHVHQDEVVGAAPGPSRPPGAPFAATSTTSPAERSSSTATSWLTSVVLGEQHCERGAASVCRRAKARRRSAACASTGVAAASALDQRIVQGSTRDRLQRARRRRPRPAPRPSISRCRRSPSP